MIRPLSLTLVLFSAACSASSLAELTDADKLTDAAPCVTTVAAQVSSFLELDTLQITLSYTDPNAIDCNAQCGAGWLVNIPLSTATAFEDGYNLAALGTVYEISGGSPVTNGCRCLTAYGVPVAGTLGITSVSEDSMCATIMNFPGIDDANGSFEIPLPSR